MTAHDARAAILARVRAAQRTSQLPAVDDVPARREPPRSRDECLERFQLELTALGVDHHLETSADAVRLRVRTLVDRRQVLSWDGEWLPYEVGTVVNDPVLGSSPREEQAAAELGITGCDAAIAETGSLALLSGPGRSRTVSLLPPVHLAIVRRDDLCFSMGEYFATRRDRIAGAACCTFVTGPSRTADIELTLTLGVHGPGRVIVVIGP